MGQISLMAPGEISAGLTGSPLFRSLGESALREFESELARRLLRGGETLFHEGEPGDALYVVVYGRLRVQRGLGAQAEVLGEVGRGEAVGELALLTGAQRSATVYAIRDTELVRLSRDGFDRLMASHPVVMLELMRQIAGRYQRSASVPVNARPVTLAVIPAGPDVPTRDFTADLVATLSRDRRVLHLRSNILADRVGSHDAADDERVLAAWLHEQELSHDYVVFEADPDASVWTRLTLRQADRALIVGLGNGVARVAPDLMQLLQSDGRSATSARRELVLLHDRTRGPPTGTAAWLSRLDVQRHHHVDMRQARDTARLARMISGTATGLVLSGGGARGLAHLGVLRALEEARVEIDLIGGTSIGAIFGAAFACGWDSRSLIEKCRRDVTRWRSLHDYTLPVMALLAGRRFMQLLDSFYGERLIEDLRLPFFCVSTNLTRGTSVVHQAGPVSRWVAASAALPGLLPPVFDGREVLVDGGVSNNMPVDVMRTLTPGAVLAVNATAGVEMRLDRAYLATPSPWHVMLSRLNPFGQPVRVPSLASILVRTATLPPSDNAGAGGGQADLVIMPPLTPFRLLDWRAVDQLVEIGYRSALERLEQWERA